VNIFHTLTKFLRLYIDINLLIIWTLIWPYIILYLLWRELFHNSCLIEIKIHFRNLMMCTCAIHCSCPVFYALQSFAPLNIDKQWLSLYRNNVCVVTGYNQSVTGCGSQQKQCSCYSTKTNVHSNLIRLRWETYTLKVVFIEHHTQICVYVSQWSQIQFEDEDCTIYMSFCWVTTTCLRREPQPVTLWLYPVVVNYFTYLMQLERFMYTTCVDRQWLAMVHEESSAASIFEFHLLECCHTL